VFSPVNQPKNMLKTQYFSHNSNYATTVKMKNGSSTSHHQSSAGIYVHKSPATPQKSSGRRLSDQRYEVY